ncbi:protein of unknown function [Xenorhabdus doucetiae]|uniref:Uncharacterized protein n=1 Tax=Xenorhabdus doucetiae TaxID=351671 RepID=A0A068QR62_9GAMM|nr:protein of unknown function [Xenorhabdus doucetiae]
MHKNKGFTLKQQKGKSKHTEMQRIFNLYGILLASVWFFSG